jgi:excisionase family DNA binding protein
VTDIALPLACSVKRAGELLGLSRSTVWNLIKDKQVETVHVGRKCLVIYSSLQAFIESRRGAE